VLLGKDIRLMLQHQGRGEGQKVYSCVQIRWCGAGSANHRVRRLWTSASGRDAWRNDEVGCADLERTCTRIVRVHTAIRRIARIVRLDRTRLLLFFPHSPWPRPRPPSSSTASSLRLPTMAALNTSSNGPNITRSYQNVVNAPPPSGTQASSPTYGQWAVFSVAAPLVSAFQGDGGKESVLKVQSTGGTCPTP